MDAYALYLHIPFCRQRCSYCDFNTYTTLSDLQAAYVAALAAEIRQVGASAVGGRPAVHTIFFGGGTPSLLTPAQLATILSAAHAAFAVDPAAEITLEANPGTVDAVSYTHLDVYKRQVWAGLVASFDSPTVAIVRAVRKILSMVCCSS